MLPQIKQSPTGSHEYIFESGYGIAGVALRRRVVRLAEPVALGQYDLLVQPEDDPTGRARRVGSLPFSVRGRIIGKV